MVGRVFQMALPFFLLTFPDYFSLTAFPAQFQTVAKGQQKALVEPIDRTLD